MKLVNYTISTIQDNCQHNLTSSSFAMSGQKLLFHLLSVSVLAVFEKTASVS
jgi:hypothetical protein